VSKKREREGVRKKEKETKITKERTKERKKTYNNKTGY
jgi:hypothetical protein